MQTFITQVFAFFGAKLEAMAENLLQKWVENQDAAAAATADPTSNVYLLTADFSAVRCEHLGDLTTRNGRGHSVATLVDNGSLGRFYVASAGKRGYMYAFQTGGTLGAAHASPMHAALVLQEVCPSAGSEIPLVSEHLRHLATTGRLYIDDEQTALAPRLEPHSPALKAYLEAPVPAVPARGADLVQFAGGPPPPHPSYVLLLNRWQVAAMRVLPKDLCPYLTRYMDLYLVLGSHRATAALSIWFETATSANALGPVEFVVRNGPQGRADLHVFTSLAVVEDLVNRGHFLLTQEGFNDLVEIKERTHPAGVLAPSVRGGIAVTNRAAREARRHQAEERARRRELAEAVDSATRALGGVRRMFSRSRRPTSLLRARSRSRRGGRGNYRRPRARGGLSK